MYGEWVTLNLGDGFEIRVFVYCVPYTPRATLIAAARGMLIRELQKGK